MEKQTVQIRRLCPGDLDRVMELWLEENCNAHPFVPESYWRENLEVARQGIAQADVFVAEARQGQIDGFIGMQKGYIAGIFVSGRQQGKGIGTALLNQAKQMRKTLTLSVYEKNKKALRFYLGAGFQEVSRGIDSDTGQTELSLTWKC